MGRLISDRVYNVCLGPSGAAQLAVPVPLNRPDTGDAVVTAWTNNEPAANSVYLVRDVQAAGDIQPKLLTGLSDILMTVIDSPCTVSLDDDVRTVTVYFEGNNAAAISQVVTLRVRVFT
jgi:hypothetical protein